MLKLLYSKKTIILDGSMGIRLMPHYPKLRIEDINLKDPDLVCSIHKEYVKSGSDIILTNTLGVNPNHYSAAKVKKLINKGVAIARNASEKGCLIAADIGPSGRLPEPYGDYAFEKMLKDFTIVAEAFVVAGVDLFYLETFPSFVEVRAALLACRKFNKPIFTTLVFDDSLRTTFGDLPESCALTLEALGAQAIGVNCTTPEVVIEVLKKMRQITKLPLIAKPNAGLPIGDKFSYGLEKMVSFIPELIEVADLVGGCCGNDSSFIKELVKNRKKRKAKKVKVDRVLVSMQRFVELDHTILVGERINPTGRKKLTQALKDRNYDYVVRQARKQENAGSEAIDVNLFVPGLDERKNMSQVVRQLIGGTTVPLFIDTKDYSAAKEALTMYPGICVLNSVCVLTKELRRWLPLARDFGSYVVISLSGRKLPKSMEDRLVFYRAARKTAKAMNFPLKHLIYDPLVFPIATSPRQIHEAMQTVTKLNALGELTILGISNVSYGLPGRSLLNAALVANAVKAKTSFIIANPLDQKVKDALLGAAILFEGRKIELGQKKEASNIKEAIIYGDQRLAKDFACKKKGDPLAIIDNNIIPALNVVGKKYGNGEIFLPQLLTSARAAKTAMDIIISRISKTAGKRGVVVLATVEGDVHDLGKNIVKVVLESHGFKVYDLGVNVSKKKIIKTVVEKKADILGLSALMTTTMTKMYEVIEYIKRNKIKVKVIVGGAPVNKEFANTIGAHYAPDAITGVKLIRQLLNVSGKNRKR